MGIVSHFFGRTKEKEELGKELREAAKAFNKALTEVYNAGLNVNIDLDREWDRRTVQYRKLLKVNYVREYKTESY